jgi:hypothetical protein
MLAFTFFCCVAIVSGLLLAKCLIGSPHRTCMSGLNLVGILLVLAGLSTLVSLQNGAVVTVTSSDAVFADDHVVTGTAESLSDQDEPVETKSAGEVAAETGSASAGEPTESAAAMSEAATDTAAENESSRGPTSDREPVAPLSVSEVIIDYDARPEWVEFDEDQNVGAVYQIAVSSGPYVRYDDARQELLKQVELQANRYINELVGNRHAATWLGYDADRVRQELIQPGHVYDEKIISPSFGVMHQSHALLQFGPDFRDSVRNGWQEIVVRGRLLACGLAAAVIIGTLSLLLTYFRADTATRGFYTGRLRFATVLVILGLVAAGAVLARSLPWIWL